MRAHRRFEVLLLVGGLTALGGCTLRGRVEYRGTVPDAVVVSTPPPAAPAVKAQATVRPARPSPDAAWVPGHYEWRGRWVWEAGHWEPNRQGYVWVAPVARRAGGQVEYHPGYWRAPERHPPPPPVYREPGEVAVSVRTAPPGNVAVASGGSVSVRGGPENRTAEGGAVAVRGPQDRPPPRGPGRARGPGVRPAEGGTVAVRGPQNRPPPRGPDRARGPRNRPPPRGPERARGPQHRTAEGGTVGTRGPRHRTAEGGTVGTRGPQHRTAEGGGARARGPRGRGRRAQAGGRPNPQPARSVNARVSAPATGTARPGVRPEPRPAPRVERRPETPRGRIEEPGPRGPGRELALSCSINTGRAPHNGLITVSGVGIGASTRVQIGGEFAEIVNRENGRIRVRVPGSGGGMVRVLEGGRSANCGRLSVDNR